MDGWEEPLFHVSYMSIKKIQHFWDTAVVTDIKILI